MLVHEIMIVDPEFIDPEASIQTAAAIMGESDTGALLVGEPDDPKGIVTDRDILLRAVARGLDSRTTRVTEVMSSSLFACRDTDAVDDVLREMREHQIRRMPVIGADGRVVGIVSQDDPALQSRTAQPSGNGGS